MVYRPTARVLTVLELLQSHGRMTGAELARRLEVNIRTVRDYIEMLGDLGIPVEAERGRYGAYRLRRRVGLIADADNGFVARLDRNRECTQALSRPNKLGATTRERIQSIEEAMGKQLLTYPTLNEVMKHIEENERLRHVSNVTARCRPLLEMNLFRPTENSVDLLTLVRSGLVIDLHNLFAETLQMATGAFMLRKLYKDMFHWGYADRLHLAIVLDEAHRLAKDITLPKLMKEGRKFGIAVVVASQGLGDFHPDVLSNAGTKVIFRMNYPESRKVSGFIRTRQGQELSERIEQLPVGSAYVQTPEMMYGSAVKMYPL